METRSPLELGLSNKKVDGPLQIGRELEIEQVDQLNVPVTFPDAPPLARAPFPPEEAKVHQDAWAEYLGIQVETVNAIGMKLVLIPPGEFMMGSPANEKWRREHEGPQHQVWITKPFFIGKYEVTQEQWQAVMGSNSSSFKGLGHPVETVSWKDCQTFIGKLNERCVQSGARYSLPTEAQWEYACRAGSTARWCFGDKGATLQEYAWLRGKRPEVSTHPVGQKRPNAWGLCDVHGNVNEWCADCYRGNVGDPSWYYLHSPLYDPTGPKSGKWRIRRGGVWRRGSRCAARSIQEPGARGQFNGFRVVCRVPAFEELQLKAKCVLNAEVAKP